MARPKKEVTLELRPADEVPALADFIAMAEGRHFNRDVFAVEITHPEVTEPRLHPGRFSGIRLQPGAPSVRYSDGTVE